MGLFQPVSGRYFDGQSAITRDVDVSFGDDGLELFIDAQPHLWPYKGLALAARDDREIRFHHARYRDAVLVLRTRDALPALTHYLPDLMSGKTAKRQMIRLATIMVVLTGLISIFLFFGVPKMAGPLASATPKDFETQMGENFSKQINLIFRPCKGSPTATTRLQPYLDKMAEEGEVGFPIVFTFVNVSAPNAFALPGGHVMATRGLLEAVGDDHEAFMAVMAHELGHVKSRDGLQAFYRNMGLGLVLEVITGGTGVAQQAVAITAQLNQLHHTRLQEARADDTAFAIMDKLNMDPAALSRAFKAIVAKSSADDSDETTPKADINKRKKRSIPGWLRSHPATDGRIERAQQRANDQAADFISNQDWQVIKSACL